MEQQADNLFQIISRSATVSTNKTNRQEVNEQLAKVQVDNNLVFENINEAFFWLLQYAIQATNNVPAKVQSKEVLPEFAVVLHENAEQEARFNDKIDKMRGYYISNKLEPGSDVSLIKEAVRAYPFLKKHHEESEAEFLEMKNQLEKLSHELEQPPTPTIVESNPEFEEKLNEAKSWLFDEGTEPSKAEILAESLKAVPELNIRVVELTSQVEEITANPSKPEPKKGVIEVSVNEKEQTLLEIISKKRQKKYKLSQAEPLSALAHGMIMNDGTVFDLAGEYYTGLNGFTKRIK